MYCFSDTPFNHSFIHFQCNFRQLYSSVIATFKSISFLLVNSHYCCCSAYHSLETRVSGSLPDRDGGLGVRHVYTCGLARTYCVCGEGGDVGSSSVQVDILSVKLLAVCSDVLTAFSPLKFVVSANFLAAASSHTLETDFLQRVSIACYAERCISHSKAVRPSVRPSDRPSVRLSVRHTLALSQNDSSYDHEVFTGG